MDRFIVLETTNMQITGYNVRLKDIHLYAHHGVMPQEREIGAWFIVDISLDMNDSTCSYSDNMESTVSYADVYEIIKAEMEKPSNLLEHVCRRISDSIYKAFDQVERIEITLYKETPPMGGDRLKAGVTLNSTR